MAARTSADSGSARELLERLRADPVLFAERILGLRLWRRQREIARALAEHDHVAVRSGHKVGKSTVAAALAIWWVHTRPGSRVLLTAPSAHQVRNILWREVRRMHRSADAPLGGELHLDPGTGYRLSGGREIIGITTDDPDRLSGISSPHLLIIVDEASGYPEHMFEALEGNLAGGGRMLMLSNPTRLSGTFYDAFHGARDLWRTIHVSSLESPCITGAEPCVPGLATPEWAERAEVRWHGPDGPIYQVRVLGQFPRQAQDAVIPLALVEEAVRRWGGTSGDGRLHIGVDVARYGDDRSVIWPRRGRRAYQPIVIQGMDVVEVAGRVIEAARRGMAGDERPVVAVDTIGIGAGVADILRRERWLEVHDVNVAESATAEGYANLRAQLWYALRDWLADGGAIPPDTGAEAELVSATYTYDARGRIRVADKDTIKRALGRSPDLADALALAVYEPPQRTVEVWGV